MITLKNFVNYLRSLEEPAKKVWLFILSGASMLVVVAIWAVYLNLTIQAVAEPEIVTQRRKAEAEAVEKARESNPLFANFKNNVSAVSKNISHFVSGLLSKKNEINIE